MKTFKEFRKNREEMRTPSSKEQSAVYTYKGPGAYYMQNSGGGVKAEKMRRGIDKLASERKTKTDINVYRGVINDTDANINGKSYVSTSLKPAAAKGFGSNIMKMRVPKGTPYIRVGSKHDVEDEILLPSGNFEKTKETKSGRYTYHHGKFIKK